MPPLGEQLRERHVRQERVGPSRIDQGDRRAQVGLGGAGVAEMLLGPGEQDQRQDALGEPLAGRDELLLGVREPLQSDLGLRVVRDRLDRARIDTERRVEPRERLGGPLLVQEQAPLPVQRVDVARIERDGLGEGVARVGRAASLEADPRLRGVRARELTGRSLRARRTLEDDREVGERLRRIRRAHLRTRPERQRSRMSRRRRQRRVDFELLAGRVAGEVVAPREAEVRRGRRCRARARA